MSLYDDAPQRVRDALQEAHENELNSFSRPGRWFSGAARATLVGKARRARCEAGLQEPGQTHERQPVVDLPEAASALAERLAVTPQDFDRAVFDGAVAAGLEDVEYVEVVGVVARAVNLDVFARGLGVAPRRLPPPIAGDPSRQRPGTAIDEGAWPATIPSGKAGGDPGAELYGGGQTANILRALSLVPPEARAIMELGKVQYLPVDRFLDFDFTQDPVVARAQVELVAGRVSAINECFY